MVTLYEKPDNNSSGWIVAIIAVAILMLVTARCHAESKAQAQVDTMACKVECIQKLVQQTTAKGTVKYYAVYNDKSIGISEIIPVAKTVVEYINMCKQYSIQPTLGIRLRNGVISGIIRYKTKFVRR
jgi:hypothetical protein